MRFSTLLIFLPVVVVAAIIAVANRQAVIFSLDPFSASFPSVALTMPLYLLVFASILIGVLLGWVTAVASRVKRRRTPSLPPVADHALPEPKARQDA